MKNFMQPGYLIDLAAPAAVSSGGGVMVGSLFGVAQASVGSGESVAVAVKGVFELPKLAADNMTVGAKVNWDNTNKWVKLATSTLDNVATVVEAAGAATTTANVMLTPV